MLHVENEYIKEHILEGGFGLEKESLRVLGDGTFAHTAHPFPKDDHIVKDFCENQTEINTSVHTSIEGAVEELAFHNERIFDKLQSLPEKEYLWPFSNPPYIENERDIPVAVFDGAYVSKMAYREYLSSKYGRYKMTFSGIHVNYSFSDDLLETDYKEEKKCKKSTLSFQEYKDRLYLDLAKKLASYGWILVAVTAASPILDSSFVEKGIFGKDVFTGMASVRCSEMGYWNAFAPIFNYDNITAYADSIQGYVDSGLLKAPSELYYPIRLKPKGENNLKTLREKGVNHIELRMFDLNPLKETGVEIKDIQFAHLLMIWLASTPCQPFDKKDQVQAMHNFKNAARYDLKTIGILDSHGTKDSVAKAGMKVIDEMKAFYRNLGLPVEDVLEFEYEKFVDAQNRYAWKIRKEFRDGYVDKVLQLAKQRQERK